MFQKFRFRRPSPAMVVALVALFVALGGTSYAVATGSIDSREIKNNTVRSSDVRNGTLLSRDFRAGQLPAGATGARGPTGPRGATGAWGPAGIGVPGPPGLSGVEQIIAPSANASESGKPAGAAAPAGKAAIGGGADVAGGSTGTPPNILADVVIDEINFFPQISNPPTSVRVRALEEEATAASWEVRAIAIC